jgi:hypothetical protein
VRACTLGLALAMSACHREMPQGAPASGLMGSYRAVLELPAGELPFGFELEREGAATVGYLVNGRERVKLDEVEVSGAHLEIRMPGHENRLSANAKDIPLRAERVRAFRFFEATAGDHAEVAARWAVTFTGDDGKPEAAVGEFSQVGDVVEDKFLAETGDHRFLAGRARGDELYLSTFDRLLTET